MMKDPLIGQQLANFRVERVLGRGGMAQVYYGLDIKLQRPVAIKVIDARYRDKPAYAKRFVNEARVLAKWRHEHIVQIYYTDDEDGLYYYVMEYIDGRNLASVIESYSIDGELMPIEDVLHIGNAVADALDYAHKQGVIHRDVKPSNILVARDGRVVLGDFGLAMDLHDGSLGETFGTPHYMSPEQASRSANAIPQSDLYSLGVILYEMLVGVVPFNDPSPTSVALQHISEPPPAPRSINAELTTEAENVLLKALEKDPQDRYQTGAELMSALKLALGNKPEKAKQPLPALPVGVPTIMHRPFSKESVTKRVAAAPIERYAVPDEMGAAKKNRMPGGILVIAVSLIALAMAGVAWQQGWFQNGIKPAVPVPVVQASSTPGRATSTSTAWLATSTQLDTPTRSTTQTKPSLPVAPPAWTATRSVSPTASYTSVATNTYPPPTQTNPPTMTAVPVIQVSNGHLFKLYYNENSLYLHNLSNVTRSISGFTFERLGQQDEVLDFFGGWDWGVFYAQLTPNRCMAIELYLSEPFLKPPECKEPYLSLLNPARAAGVTFWTTDKDSIEFRVLWLRQEIARCKVGAGVCEFHVP